MRCVALALAQAHGAQVVPRRGAAVLRRHALEGQRCTIEIAAGKARVALAESGEFIGRPARGHTVVGPQRLRRWRHALEADRGLQRVGFTRRHRQAPRWQRGEGPMAAARPGALEQHEAHQLALCRAAAHDHGTHGQVVADDDGVMPARRKGQPEVLQHDHGLPRRHFGQQRDQGRWQGYGDGAKAPRGGEHFGLQGAIAGGQEYRVGQGLGCRDQAAMHQHRSQRSGAAVVWRLREERHLAQLGAWRQRRRRCERQGRALRRLGEYGAAAQAGRADAEQPGSARQVHR